MFNWNDQDQVGFLLWEKHRKNEDHILPLPTDKGNILLTFEECSNKQREEDASNTTRSTVETSGAKHDFLNCNVEKRSGNSYQDCNDSSLQMDAWSDLPYLSSVLNDGFNDGSDHDSAVTGLMNDLADASNLYSGVSIMTRYDNSSELFLNKPHCLSTGDVMQLDDEPGRFGDDEKGNDSFLYYNWDNIEDLDDLDKILKNNDSFDRNEEVHSANSFHYSSADLNSNTFQSIAVPSVPTSMDQTSDSVSPNHRLGEHYDANVNSLFTEKADGQSQTWRSQEEEKGKGTSFQGQYYSYSSEKQPISSSEVQGSNVNPFHIVQSSSPLGQECSSKNQTLESTDSMKEYKHKQSTPEVSYLEEQYQYEVMSSLINGRSVEVATYHQLQYAIQKLDLSVRLNIRDSLFRLARSAMERLNASDKSCAHKNKDEYEISSNHDRSFSMEDTERVTNPIDRIVAHLLFHNSSGSYSLPIGDGNVHMATSMRAW